MEEEIRRLLLLIAAHVSEMHSEWPEFKALVFQMRQQQIEHERRLVQLEGRWDTHETQHAADHHSRLRIRELGPASYDPDKTPHGGIRLPPEGWERLQTEFEQFKEETKVAKARAEGATGALDNLKKNIKFYLMLAGTAGTVLAYVLTHFFKL